MVAVLLQHIEINKNFLPKSLKITFVILTWNSKFHIEKCIDSICRTIDEKLQPYEISIVDNGSNDGTKKLLHEYASKFPDVIKPIFLENNKGTTYSRNLALKQAKGEYVCVLDSDVEVLEGTVDKLISNLSNDQSIGLASPRLTYGDGRLQKSTDDFPTILSKFFRFFFLKFQEKVDQKKEGNPFSRDVDYTISAFWIFRRSLLDLIGLLDENIFYAPEDVDYCLRIWRCGLRIVYEPTATAIHNAQEISRKFSLNKAKIEHIKGLIYFFNKHGYWFSRPVFKNKRIGV